MIKAYSYVFPLIHDCVLEISGVFNFFGEKDTPVLTTHIIITQSNVIVDERYIQWDTLQLVRACFSLFTHKKNG